MTDNPYSGPDWYVEANGGTGAITASYPQDGAIVMASPLLAVAAGPGVVQDAPIAAAGGSPVRIDRVGVW
jgi:hypothetical protein